MDLGALIKALPSAATSWPALIAYVVLSLVVWLVQRKTARTKLLLERLEKVPANDREKLLRQDMGGAYLARGMTAEQYLRNQRSTYVFIAFMAMLVTIIIIVGMAFNMVRAADRPDKPGPIALADCRYIMLTVKDAIPAGTTMNLELWVDGVKTAQTIDPNPAGEGIDAIAVLRGYPQDRKVQLYAVGTVSGQERYTTHILELPSAATWTYREVGTEGHIPLPRRDYELTDGGLRSEPDFKIWQSRTGIYVKPCSAYGEGSLTMVKNAGRSTSNPLPSEAKLELCRHFIYPADEYDPADHDIKYRYDFVLDGVSRKVIRDAEVYHGHAIPVRLKTGSRHRVQVYVSAEDKTEIKRHIARSDEFIVDSTFYLVEHAMYDDFTMEIEVKALSDASASEFLSENKISLKECDGSGTTD